MENISAIYSSACERANVSPIPEFVSALMQNQKTVVLQSRIPPLTDDDICCIAEAIQHLNENANLKVLGLEENSFGLNGVQALMESLEKNPHRIRGLRLGKNNLKDTCAALIGQSLCRSSYGLKVLDLSENGITRLGVLPVAAALQNSNCEVVELSFHSNKIEGDAAAELVEGVKNSSSLKHLHLGYNTLRDTGAHAIARGLPQLSLLVTLDLTANRIGPDGGEALAAALCDPNCKLQRLNLRYNLLESKGIAAFERVIRKNKSLIQLFLGFMSPTPEVGEEILKALTENRALLLLDILGWKFHQQRTLEILPQIQEENNVLAALVTDACHAILPQVQEANKRRGERGIHPLYVGSDDREAYVATKSEKRFSRVQSRNSSRARSRSVRSDRSGRMSVVRVRKASHGGPGRSGSTTSSHEYCRQHSSRRIDEEVKKQEPSFERDQKRTESLVRNERAPSSSFPNPTTGELLAKQQANEMGTLLLELEMKSQCDPETKRVMKEIVNTLWEKLQQQNREVQAVYSRIANLERRRECSCAQRSYPEADFNLTSPNYRRLDQRSNMGTGGAIPFSSSHSVLHSQTMNALASTPRNQQQYNSANYAGSFSYPSQQSPSTMKVGPSVPLPPAPSTPQATRSVSRGRYDLSDPGRAVTPLVRPSEQHDLPPNISSRATEESGARRPEEASLQRSATVINVSPRLEPSPAPDRNPPRRKITPSALIS